MSEEAEIQKLVQRLPGAEISCWGIGQSMASHPRGRRYYGTIAAVDEKDPCHLTVKDGNISELRLHFRLGDHVVTLHEKSENGEGFKADFVAGIECGYAFEKDTPVFLLDFMRSILKS